MYESSTPPRRLAFASCFSEVFLSRTIHVVIYLANFFRFKHFAWGMAAMDHDLWCSMLRKFLDAWEWARACQCFLNMRVAWLSPTLLQPVVQNTIFPHYRSTGYEKNTVVL